MLISPTLATTIGLEETVMLHVLAELLADRAGVVNNKLLIKGRLKWVQLSCDDLLNAFPFWALIDIKRVQKNLQDLGLIVVEAVLTEDSSYLIAINQTLAESSIGSSERDASAQPTVSQSVTPQNNTPQNNKKGASYIPVNWQPSRDLVMQCRQLSIPEKFIYNQVPSFVMYWRERQQSKHSWNTVFRQLIIREWRHEQSRKGAQELSSDMSAQWRPSEEALMLLELGGIKADFIEDAIPEFVLYWCERGLVTSTWNTKFLLHVRKQWTIFTATIEHDNTPRRIPLDWQPSPECYDVLRLAEIDVDFARREIKEFVLYWKDSNQVQQSWNTKFLQHTKYKWANQHQMALRAGGTHAQNQSATGTNQQPGQSAIERFTDRSWADAE